MLANEAQQRGTHQPGFQGRETGLAQDSLRHLRSGGRREAIDADAVLLGRFEHLADFLQGALERSRAPNSTLGQEVELVENYLAIMQIRLGSRLRFTVRMTEDLRDVPFPPLLLQTLVENAVTHGIEPSAKEGTIDLTARRDGARIVVRVADDGVGIAGKDCAHGVGLTNTRERLATFYAGKATFELVPNSPSGTVAALTIPAGS